MCSVLRFRKILYVEDITVLSAGWQLAINAFSPKQVQFNVAEREQ